MDILSLFSHKISQIGKYWEPQSFKNCMINFLISILKNAIFLLQIFREITWISLAVFFLSFFGSSSSLVAEECDSKDAQEQQKQELKEVKEQKEGKKEGKEESKEEHDHEGHDHEEHEHPK